MNSLILDEQDKTQVSWSLFWKSKEWFMPFLIQSNCPLSWVRPYIVHLRQLIQRFRIFKFFFNLSLILSNCAYFQRVCWKRNPKFWQDNQNWANIETVNLWLKMREKCSQILLLFGSINLNFCRKNDDFIYINYLITLQLAAWAMGRGLLHFADMSRPKWFPKWDE